MCIQVIEALAARDEANQSGEIRVFRHLLELASKRKLNKKELKQLPLRTYTGWQPRRTVTYAVETPVLGQELGTKWPVWDPPLSLDALTPLLESLGVVFLDKSSFEADIPSRVAVGTADLHPGFVSAVGHLSDYLARHHPDLHKRLSPTRWRELASADVIAGSGWGIIVRAAGRRSVRLTPRAYLFDDPLRFCVRHEDEIGERESGGLAIAGYFLGEDRASEDRSTLALAWAEGYRKRDQAAGDINLSDPDQPDEQVDERAFEKFRGRGRRPKRVQRRPAGGTPKPERQPPRELNELNQVDLTQVSGAWLEGKRRGRLKPSVKVRLKTPRTKTGAEASNGPSPRAGQRQYSDRDREDVAFELVAAVFQDLHGLDLEDIRDQGNAGADAIDRAQDIWVELKAHGQDPADTLRLEPAEAARAKEKGGNYLLVVVWDLEKPRTPQYAVIPNPLERLDIYLGRGVSLSGVQELTEETGS